MILLETEKENKKERERRESLVLTIKKKGGERVRELA